MPELKGSKTEKNLQEAFAGESQARNKYTYYAVKAQKEGYEQVAGYFLKTADNEREHAEIWFKYLMGGRIPSTVDNLKDAAAGEHGEWTDMYKRMSEEAKAEGFDEIADKFAMVGDIEKHHEERYLKLLDNINNRTVFHRDDPNTVWVCRNCGHVHHGNQPPTCPVCAHEQSWFQLLIEDY